MKRLAFKPEHALIYIQYRDGSQIQEFILSIHNLMDMHSKEQFSRSLFEILNLLKVDSDIIQQVGTIIAEAFEYPNHIFTQNKMLKVVQTLSETFPSVDYDSARALEMRHGNNYKRGINIPLQWEEALK